jgi:hypothetical protein
MALFAVITALVLMVLFLGKRSRRKSRGQRAYQRLPSGDTLIRDERGRVIANANGRNPMQFDDR